MSIVKAQKITRVTILTALVFLLHKLVCAALREMNPTLLTKNDDPVVSAVRNADVDGKWNEANQQWNNKPPLGLWKAVHSRIKKPSYGAKLRQRLKEILVPDPSWESAGLEKTSHSFTVVKKSESRSADGHPRFYCLTLLLEKKPSCK